jgi:hypothetical protein
VEGQLIEHTESHNKLTHTLDSKFTNMINQLKDQITQQIAQMIDIRPQDHIINKICRQMYSQI